MSNYFNKGKWKRFLSENKKYSVEEACGDTPPMPAEVPIPAPDADPMALAAELGAIGLDPAMVQSVVDLLLSKGMLGSVSDPAPVHPAGAPPVMESATWDALKNAFRGSAPDAKAATSDAKAATSDAKADDTENSLSQYSEEAIEAARAALEIIPNAGIRHSAALENEIHHYLETGFGETKRPREIFKIADEALAVAGVILGLGPDAL